MMDDIKGKAKKAVLEQIMELMDGAMTEGLKSKSPKFMSVEVEAEAKPEVEGLEAEKEEMSSPLEEKPEVPTSEGEMDDEDKMRLKELYERFAK